MITKLAFLSFVVQSTLLSSFLHANEKTEEQYWLEARANFSLVTSAKVFDNCYQNFSHFEGCLAAVNVAAEAIYEGHSFLPESLVGESQIAQPHKLKLKMGSFVLAKLKNTSESEADKLTPSQAWQKSQSLKVTQRESLVKIFEDSQQNQILFDATYVGLINSQSIGSALRPKVIADSVTAFLKATEDAFSRIVPMQQLIDDRSSSETNFVGVGVTLEAIGNILVFTRVIDGGGAQKAGAKEGDRLLSVDGIDIPAIRRELALKWVVDRIRGVEGTQVNLKLLRGDQELSLIAIRQRVSLPNVESQTLSIFNKNIGVIRLADFQSGSACHNIEKAIAKFESQKVDGLIFDLRRNPGGDIRQAVCIASLFVGKKVITSVRNIESGGLSAKAEPHIGQKEAVTDLPLITLINAGSASASELVSGALQDYKRSWIVGERSAGKGSVQTGSLWLPNIYKFKTTAIFFRPSGLSNQRVGIIPDIEVKVRPDATEDELFRVRMPDLFPSMFEVQQPAWKQFREQDVSQIDSCLKSGQKAQLEYNNAAVPQVFDYQQAVAAEVLTCL